MNKICFLTVFLISLFCFTGNAQDVTNKSVSKEKGIKSMLPPQLSYPANEEVIDMNYPILIWIPPRPINGMMVTYSLRLVEVSAGQTSAEALLQNPPLINLSGLSNTFLNYPVDAQPLQINEHYAWQVSASYAGQSLGITDIWTFSLKNNDGKKDDDMEYPVAAKVSKERFYLSHGIFHFMYNNIANEKMLTYHIESMDKSNTNIKGLPPIALQPGMNKLQVDLKQNGQLKNNTYYYLEIKDKRRQVYKLMYYYVRTK